MCRVAARDLGTSRQAPGRTREWARDVLRRWELDPELDRTLLVLNELVTNAVVHSPGGASCRITVDGGALEIFVTDAGAGPPRRAMRRADARHVPGDAIDPADEAEWERPGGRGLQIVAAVADRWGTTFAGSRAGVWARWRLGDGWPYADACTCPSLQRTTAAGSGSADGAGTGDHGSGGDHHHSHGHLVHGQQAQDQHSHDQAQDQHGHQSRGHGPDGHRRDGEVLASGGTVVAIAGPWDALDAAER